MSLLAPALIGLGALIWGFRWGYRHGQREGRWIGTEYLHETIDKAWKAGWRAREISQERIEDFGSPLHVEQQRRASEEGLQ